MCCDVTAHGLRCDVNVASESQLKVLCTVLNFNTGQKLRSGIKTKPFVTRRIAPKHVTSWRCPSPRHSAKATQLPA